MNPTGPLRHLSRPWALWAFALISAFAHRPLLAADDPMPRPPELERDVQFWIRVYTQIDTNSGFLHDQYNLGVVYDTLHFAPDSAARTSASARWTQAREALRARRCAASPTAGDGAAVRRRISASGSCGARKAPRRACATRSMTSASSSARPIASAPG